MTATGSENVNSNSIITGFSKGASGGTITFFDTNGLSVNGSTMTNNLNNFSNVTVKGSTVIAGWNNIEGSSNSILRWLSGSASTRGTCSLGTSGHTFGGHTRSWETR